MHYQERGIALGNLGRYEEALEAFNKALEINPEDESDLLWKGFVLLSLNKHEETVEAFSKALEINPKNDYALSRKGIALANLGRYEEALEALNKGPRKSTQQMNLSHYQTKDSD